MMRKIRNELPHSRAARYPVGKVLSSVHPRSKLRGILRQNKGYTFVELLVVVTIMSFLGIGILLRQNFSREDNALKNASADLQSLIRLAQSNAQTSALCENIGSASWSIEPTNTRKRVDLKCDGLDPNPPLIQKSLNLDTNIEVLSIRGTGSCDTLFPFQILDIDFATLSGKITFTNPAANSCVVTSSYLDITLRNTKSGNTATVTVDKGGMIDVR